MRFRYIFVFLLLFWTAFLYGQKYDYGYENAFRDNWFVSGAVGVNALNVGVGHFDSPATAALDFNFGKWFNPMFGARVGWQGVQIATSERTFGYNYVHGDLLWDVVSTFGGYKQDRLWTMMPYVNVGMYLNTSRSRLASKGFGAGVGLQNNFRLNHFLSVYLDLRATMMSERAVLHSAGKVLMTSAMAGVQFDLGKSGWDYVGNDPVFEGERKRLVNRGFWKDWFFSIGGGVDAVTNGRRWTGFAAPTGDISIGKWFSSFAGARLGVQGLGMRQNITGDRMDFAYLHADLLWNWTNTFCRTRGWHLWTASPYLHLGVFNSMEHLGERFKSEFAAGAGLYNLFAITPNVDLFADVRGTLLNGRSIGRDRGMLLQVSLMAGLVYNINSRTLLWKKQQWDKEEGVRYLPGEAQYNGFFGNWSVYLAGGANVLSLSVLNPSNLRFKPAFDFGVQKMFSPTFGGRLGLQGGSLAANDANYGWSYLHGDVLWDFRRTVAGYDPERIWSIDPYVTMGVSFLRRNSLIVQPTAGVGLLNSWKLTGSLGIFADVRGLVLSERQFGTGGRFSVEASALAGLSFTFGKDVWDGNGTGVHLNGFWDNWFIQASGGAGMVLDTWSRFNGRPAPSMELAVGKWFSPDWGGRLGVLFENMAKDDDSEFDCLYVHADLLWNMSNTFGGFKPDRIYSASPYIHFGVMNSWNHFSSSKGVDYAAGVGLLNDFRLDDKMSFIVDLRGRGMFGRLTGKSAGKALGGELLVGLSYNLGEGGWEPYRQSDKVRGPLSISTNLASWADLATVNLSLEYACSRNWSTDVTFEFNNWQFKEGSLSDRRRCVTVGARYWPWYTYSGFWLRPFLGAESSSSEGLPLKFLNGTADRIGAGFSAGYSLMLSRHLNLDFGLGLWGGVSHRYQGPWGAFILPKDLRISLMFVL